MDNIKFTPQDILHKQFKEKSIGKGYDVDDVDDDVVVVVVAMTRRASGYASCERCLLRKAARRGSGSARRSQYDRR